MRWVRWPVCKYRSSGSSPFGLANTWLHLVRLCSRNGVDCFAHRTPSGVFGLLQIIAFAELVRSHVSSKQFQTLLFASVIGMGVLGALGIVGLTYKGWIAPWTGRFYSLWDTGYAKKYVIFTATESVVGLINSSPGTFQSSPLCLSINRQLGHRSSWISSSWFSYSRLVSSCVSANFVMNTYS